MYVQKNGMCGVSDIGECLGITSAAASQMIERLVGFDLLHREEDPRDRRAKRIQLTETGSTLLDELVLNREKWFDGFASSMTEEERDLAVRGLRLLRDKLNELERGQRG